jgi:hypothetical protein
VRSVQLFAGSAVEPPSIERIAIFHYVTRSAADFAAKRARGGGQNRDGKPWSFFDEIAKCALASRCASRPPLLVAYLELETISLKHAQFVVHARLSTEVHMGQSRIR